MGVQLMLDDFGTGYSSLNYLQLFPLDYVKIDRPFINRTGAEHANTGMTQAMLQMAPSLGLTAIAEIIETEAAAHALRQMGCAFGQGYFFSEPVAAELALQFLRDQPFIGLLQPWTVGPGVTTVSRRVIPEDDIGHLGLAGHRSPTISRRRRRRRPRPNPGAARRAGPAAQAYGLAEAVTQQHAVLHGG